MMHPPAREGIEGYLAGKPDAGFLEHLAACPECTETVSQLEYQARLIRTLKAPVSPEPDPGFYARVMDHIEAQKESSIWSVFLEPLFARRLMYASAVLTLLLGLFLFTSPKDDYSASASMPEQILAADPHPAPQLVDSEQDRNTVFVQLTTYQE
ncbi:MAG: hypothetical protein LC126_17870 [Bryobacterales bacterium]|nr:hypothetical protein [Bryobacterales bacterium]